MIFYDSDKKILRIKEESGELREVSLRPKEYGLWELLSRHSDCTVSRKVMCEEVWAGRYVSDFTINQTINHLRKKIGVVGKDVIITVPRNGYAIISKFLDKTDSPVMLSAVEQVIEKSALLHEHAERVFSNKNDKGKKGAIICDDYSFIPCQADPVSVVGGKKSMFKKILMRMCRTFVK